MSDPNYEAELMEDAFRASAEKQATLDYQALASIGQDGDRLAQVVHRIPEAEQVKIAAALQHNDMWVVGAFLKRALKNVLFEAALEQARNQPDDRIN